MTQKKERVPAYLTVYLALVMGILISLCLVLIEGVRKNTIRLETECIMDIAMNSVLAEYHRELFQQYNLFAIDASYGTPYASVHNTERHLHGYIEQNLSKENIFLSNFLYKDFLAMELADENEVEVTKVSIFTDGNGTVFRRRAVDAVKDDVGINLLEDILDWMEVVDSQELLETNIESQMQQVDEEIQSYDGKQIPISETEWVTIDVSNPAESLNQLRRKGILETVIAKPWQLSSKSVVLETLIGERLERGEVSYGNVAVKEVSGMEELTERFFFQEYLLRYMGCYGQEKENSALDYQVEYLLAGKSNDIENLKSVADRLCALRGAANAIYLFSDEEKCAEAEVVGMVLATLFQIPEAEQIFKYAILLGWTYAESLYDVETLLAGGRIPLMKSYDSWHYNLDDALQVGGFQGTSDGQAGLCYEDYLRIFMMFTEEDLLTSRAMDMIEADIRLTSGNEAFRIDGCYDGLEANMHITSAYGYEYEICRKKYYSLY